jgi:hypothetical protein
VLAKESKGRAGRQSTPVLTEAAGSKAISVKEALHERVQWGLPRVLRECARGVGAMQERSSCMVREGWGSQGARRPCGWLVGAGGFPRRVCYDDVRRAPCLIIPLVPSPCAEHVPTLHDSPSNRQAQPNRPVQPAQKGCAAPCATLSQPQPRPPPSRTTTLAAPRSTHGEPAYAHGRRSQRGPLLPLARCPSPLARWILPQRDDGLHHHLLSGGWRGGGDLKGQLARG